VEDLPGKLTELKEQGVRLVDEQPTVMDDSRQLAFIHLQGSG